MRARAVELIRSGWNPRHSKARLASGALLGVAAGLVLADMPDVLVAACIGAAAVMLCPLG